MADWYVDSAATGTNAGTSWTNACTSFSQLLALGVPPVAGDRMFVHNTSSETYTAVQTLAFPGTEASPNQIYSTDTTNTPPNDTDLVAGATINMNTTGNLSITGSIYTWGLNLKIGNGATAQSVTLGQNLRAQVWDNLTIDLSGQTGTGTINLGVSGGGVLMLLAPTIKTNTGNILQNIVTTSLVRIKGGGMSGNYTNQFITLFTNSIGVCSIEGFDFSPLGANGGNRTIVAQGNNSAMYIKDCKLPATITLDAAGTSPQSLGLNNRTLWSRTDSTGSVNMFRLNDYAGLETRETSITRVGGGADFNSSLFSKKIVSTANVKYYMPFETIPMSIVNTATGSAKTVTVFGTINAGAVPNNDDIWLEVEYPKDSGDPLGGYVYDTKGSQTAPSISPLSSGSALASDGSTWNGGGSGVGWSPFKMTVSITPQLAGPITVRVYVAKTSTTYYIDPQPTIT